MSALPSRTAAKDASNDSVGTIVTRNPNPAIICSNEVCCTESASTATRLPFTSGKVRIASSGRAYSCDQLSRTGVRLKS